MVQLFLDKTEIIPDASTTIKVTKENPYFTLSDSYTLEVTIPLDIYENKVFFGSLNRTEKSKKYKEYSAELRVDNKQILKGQARITTSTNKEVKVQITTGVSALKMTAANDSTYIDEMELGTFTSRTLFPSDLDAGVFSTLNYPDLEGYAISGYGIPMLDNTNDIHPNVCNTAGQSLIGLASTHRYVSACPLLLEVARAITNKLGYTLDCSILPAACSSIYIVTGIMSHQVAKKLPHWTVSEFFDQLQNFLGCTIEDAGDKALSLVQLNSYAERDVIVIEPTEEFEVDYTEEDEAKGVINTNLEFSLNGTTTETVDEEILEKALNTYEYDNIAAATNAFTAESEETRMKNIYKVHGELYIGWKDGDTVGLKRIAPFNRLTRYEDASYTSLKISPVFITEDEECSFTKTDALETYTPTVAFTANIPSVTNNFGVIDRGVFGTGSDESDDFTLQGLVEGDEEIESEADKEDMITVAFLDGLTEEVTAKNADHPDRYSQTLKAHFAFTDARFKQQFTNNRKNWSFSLKEVDDFDFYLGQLHKLDWQCSRKCKLKVTFEADTVPDPKNIYIIRNKRYACEKIEADIKNGKLEPLMTGYFYEMTDN